MVSVVEDESDAGFSTFIGKCPQCFSKSVPINNHECLPSPPEQDTRNKKAFIVHLSVSLSVHVFVSAYLCLPVIAFVRLSVW